MILCFSGGAAQCAENTPGIFLFALKLVAHKPTNRQKLDEYFFMRQTLCQLRSRYRQLLRRLVAQEGQVFQGVGFGSEKVPASRSPGVGQVMRQQNGIGRLADTDAAFAEVGGCLVYRLRYLCD